MRRRNLPHVHQHGQRALLARGRARLRRLKGYLLLELAITLMVVAVIGIYTRSVALQQMDDGVAAATGTYVLAGAAGLETYMLANTTALMNGQVVAGVANALQPTMAELQALTVNNSPMLPNTFPALSPTRQALQFNVQRINNAGTVELRATACLNAPLLWRRGYRDDMVTVAMQSMSGRGGRSMLVDNGATIRGPLITAGILPNPVLNRPVGILCSVNLLSNAFYSSFARQQDARPLNFSGVVTTAGAVNAIGAVTATGVVDVSGGTLTLPAAGAACATVGAIAWLQTGASFSPARCDGAKWVSAGGALPIWKVGDACTTDGALAATAQGSALICQSATYLDFVSRMGGLVAMESLIVSHGSRVNKPTCASAAASTAIYLFPMTDVQTNDTVFRSAVDNATSIPPSASWTISIADSTNMVVAGDALAMTYCVY